MNKFFTFAKNTVVDPVKRHPKFAISVAVIGAFGALGSGLKGFTDFFDFFGVPPANEQPTDQKFVTHEQFDLLVIPLIEKTIQMDQKIDRLERQLEQSKDNDDLETKSSNDDHPAQPHLDQQLLRDRMDQVKELQQNQE